MIAPGAHGLESGSQRTQKALRATQRTQSAPGMVRSSQSPGMGARPGIALDADRDAPPSSPRRRGLPPTAGGSGGQQHGPLCPPLFPTRHLTPFRSIYQA